MFDDLNDLYQQVILDHSKKPRNYGRMENPTCDACGKNPLCGDRIQVFAVMDGDKIREVRFEGDGCAIFKASASMMTDSLKGKTQAESHVLFDEFHELITKGTAPANHHLGKLEVFGGVNRFPARVKCALLSWRAAMAAVGTGEKTVSTE